MTIPQSDPAMLRLLVLKDWQVYQKQLAGYLAGLVLALSLIGSGGRGYFYAGGLLLIVLLVATGFFAIGQIVVNERKEATAPFVMSLPVTPTDVFFAKLLAGLLLYLVPLLAVGATTVVLVLATSLPDGLLVYALLLYGFLLASHCVALCFAIAIESEGWNIFLQMALMTMLSPFLLGVARLPSVAANFNRNDIVWSAPVLAILAAELFVAAAVIALSCWYHSRQAPVLQGS